MLLIIFAILCSVASYGLFLVLKMIMVLPYSSSVGGLIALTIFILVLVVGRLQKNKITIKTLTIPIAIIAIVISIIVVSALTSPARALPEGLKKEDKRVCANCKLLSVQKTKFLETDNFMTPGDDAWCMVYLIPDQDGSTRIVADVGYYNKAIDHWMIEYLWFEKDFIEHGCTNYPK